MAKGQRRKPGRDVRGGGGRRGQGGARPARDARSPQGRDGKLGGFGAHRGDSRRRDVERTEDGRPKAHDVRDHSSKGRRSAGSGHDAPRAYIEGRRACAEALDAGVPLRRALVAQGAGSAGDASFERLMGRLAAAGVEIEAVPRARLDALSSHGAHQGVMLEVEPFSYATLDDIVAAASGRDEALVVVLDHVVDEGNLGAIVRSAEVVGASGVVVAKARAAGVGVGAYKASAGAVLHVPIARVANVASAVDALKQAGFWAAAATEHAGQTVWDAPLVGRVALVMGAEKTGVSRLVRERCDFECRLPQRGRVESLNVAQAATALCYEWLRRGYETQVERDASQEGRAMSQGAGELDAPQVERDAPGSGHDAPQGGRTAPQAGAVAPQEGRPAPGGGEARG